MRVFLDGEPLQGAGATLAEAINAARTKAEAGGRVIVEVLADGRTPPDAHLGDPSLAGEGPYAEELVIVSEPPNGLVRRALMDAVEALDQAVEQQRAFADRVHAGEPEDAIGALSEVISTWDGVRRVVLEGGRLLGRSLDPSARMESLIASLSESLMQVRSLLSAQDWAGLADEVGEGLTEQAGEWRAHLTGLAESLR